MKDFVLLTHQPTGQKMLVAVDSIEAVVPSGDHARVYVGGHVYFDTADTVEDIFYGMLHDDGE